MESKKEFTKDVITISDIENMFKLVMNSSSLSDEVKNMFKSTCDEKTMINGFLKYITDNKDTTTKNEPEPEPYNSVSSLPTSSFNPNNNDNNDNNTTTNDEDNSFEVIGIEGFNNVYPSTLKNCSMFDESNETNVPLHYVGVEDYEKMTDELYHIEKSMEGITNSQLLKKINIVESIPSVDNQVGSIIDVKKQFEIFSKSVPQPNIFSPTKLESMGISVSDKYRYSYFLLHSNMLEPFGITNIHEDETNDSSKGGFTTFMSVLCSKSTIYNPLIIKMFVKGYPADKFTTDYAKLYLEFSLLVGNQLNDKSSDDEYTLDEYYNNTNTDLMSNKKLQIRLLLDDYSTIMYCPYVLEQINIKLSDLYHQKYGELFHFFKRESDEEYKKTCNSYIDRYSDKTFYSEILLSPLLLTLWDIEPSKEYIDRFKFLADVFFKETKLLGYNKDEIRKKMVNHYFPTIKNSVVKKQNSEDELKKYFPVIAIDHEKEKKNIIKFHTKLSSFRDAIEPKTESEYETDPEPYNSVSSLPTSVFNPDLNPELVKEKDKIKKEPTVSYSSAASLLPKTISSSLPTSVFNPDLKTDFKPATKTDNNDSSVQILSLISSLKDYTIGDFMKILELGAIELNKLKQENNTNTVNITCGNYSKNIDKTEQINCYIVIKSINGIPFNNTGKNVISSQFQRIIDNNNNNNNNNNSIDSISIKFIENISSLTDLVIN